MKKKVLFLWNYFYLESEKGNSRFVTLARMITNSSFDLEIVTSSFYHMGKYQRKISKEELDSLPYKVTFINEPGYKKNVSLSRVISMNMFNNGVKSYLYSIKDKPDIIYVPVPSIKLGNIASKYCKKNNIKLVIDIEDLWPESFKMLLHSEVLTKILFFPGILSANRLYRNADAIIAVSQTYMDRAMKLRKDNPPHEVVYIGADFQKASQVPLDTSIKPKGEIWLTYIGTLGKSYNLKLFIDVIDKLYQLGHKEYVLKILGSGPDEEKLKEYSKDKKGRTEFLGLLKYEDMVKILKVSDYGLNPINKNSVASIINKVADYTSIGLPVINTQRCKEYEKILEDTRSGVTLNENVDEIIWFLINNNKVFDRKPINIFDRKGTYKNIVDLIGVIK